MAEKTPGTTTVTDHRTPPRGVLPRRTQAWLMAALALGVLAIIVFTGRPTPPERIAPTMTGQPAAPNPDRLRDYQDRLRVLDERSRQLPDVDAIPPPAPVLYEDRGAPPVDPIEEEQRRREYESLFASNVVVSRRPDGQHALSAGSGTPFDRAQVGRGEPSAPPSLDDVADAVMRATARSAPTPPAPGEPPPVGDHQTRTDTRPSARPTPPITASGPMHRLLEGTFIDAVLTNRLDGTSAAPVNCLVTNPVYSHSGQHILIPAGTRVLGQTTPVQSLGETRLAVSFHRLLFPDGRTYPLDQFMGLNQIGDSGLRDRVNQHYLSTFGAAAAVGLITGLSQLVGTAGFGRGDANRTVVIAGGLGDATGQASAHVLQRFLNRLPTITIREGHRVKVYLTTDLDLPAYASGRTLSRLP
jgi:type IV secretory pathway VirB10-like protein